MSRYQAYAEYKDSGADWFDSAPAHWDVKRISYFSQMRSGDAIVSEQIEAEGEYPVYGGNGLRGFTNNFNLNGDYVLIGRQGALCGNINYGSGKFWASEHAVVVYPFLDVNLKWLGETLRAMNLNQYNVSAAQPGLAVANITCLKVPFPKKSEQDAIANFLDHETAKIDLLIEKQQALIELLKEKRQTVISHAVTKGLNPNAPMKDSGVEWLGEVPAHWVVTRAKFISNIFVPQRNKPELNEESGVPWATMEDMKGQYIESTKNYVSSIAAKNAGSKILSSGSVIASCVGNFGVAAINCMDVIINQQLQAFIPTSIKAEYLRETVAMSKSYFELIGTAATLIYVNQQGFENLPVLIPPKTEQDDICKFIETESLNFTKLIARCEEAIKLMQERRTALISSAVTGKIDVRDWQAPN
ncbi:restriction endonuclease subunit S [Iodobacter sp. LRB]|uniref:restriction endonuclease subunit S n=1 Tax=unclassified Iodobacter TaxID=235634 RepID=UPI000C102658|nr:restriction endonuclease subunit S [Iodobacter sp. BJB302]PHV01017.1 restriction endonuclease subunit S [Iodobacter sp. BJB302]